MPATKEAVHLIELRAEGFQRLNAVHVKLSPGGKLLPVSGKNASGKTALLDAIEAALTGTIAGKRGAGRKTVKEGSSKAVVTLDLGEVVVERKWTPDGKGSVLTVSAPNGARFPSPQAMLDGIVGRFAIDPYAFIRDESGQAETLRKLLGIDTSDLDEAKAQAYAERAEANREVRSHAAALSQMQPYPDAPDEPVSISDLTTKHRQATAQVAAKAKASADLRAVVVGLEMTEERIKDLERQLREQKAKRETAKAGIAERTASIEAMPVPDIESIEQQMRDAESINLCVIGKRSYRNAQQRLAAEQEKSANLTDKLAAIDEAKLSRLQAVKFPVEGLGIEGDTVVFNDAPLAQASGAEKIRVGLGVGAAQHPRLRLILIRDGSLIDDEGMSALDKWTVENGYLTLIERVPRDEAECVGIVIVDGTAEYEG